MAKGHRLLKKKKLEKSKVKLKGTQAATIFKKGSNITDTSFKIRPIVIREQLKVKNQQVPLSKRKLNIKELLSKLHHYNISVRHVTIKELKEFISVYPEEMMNNFSVLLSGVAHLVLDKEKSVRRESLRTIALILSQASVEQISPFFDILSSYLRCAMTHIDSSIQEDSLLLLDTLLEFAPSLVVANSHKIMANFFDLISKLRSDFKPGRTLTMNLGRKMTVVKWRIKVLNRLQHMLVAIIENHGDDNKNLEMKIIEYNEKLPYLSIYRTEYIQPCILTLNETKSVKPNETLENNMSIMNYMEVLMPLLFETWLEVGPASVQDGHNIDSALTEEAVRILSSILNILTLIFSYIKIYEKGTGKYETTSNFILKYKDDYLNYVIQYFPYIQMRIRNEESQCYLQNLMICRIFCLFYKNLQRNIEKKYASKLLHYVHSSLSHWRTFSAEHSTEMVNLLRILLFELSTTWRDFHQDFLTIIDDALIASSIAQQTKGNKDKIQGLLCELVTANTRLSRHGEYQNWLSKIPELLNEAKISELFIDNLLLLVKQQHIVLIESLKNIFKNVLRNLSNIVITDTENAIKAKCKIIGLFYYLLEDKEMLNCAKEFQSSDANAELKKYMEEILIYKFGATCS